MKKTSFYAAAILAMAFNISCNSNSGSETTAVNDGPPYTIQLEEYVNEKRMLMNFICKSQETT